MPYPDTVALNVVIRGKDVTQQVWLNLAPLVIESVLTRQIDACSFTIGDYQGWLARQLPVLAPFSEWDEIIVTDTKTSTKLFAGFVQQINDTFSATGNRTDAKFVCGDYACVLDHVLVKQQYITTSTDADILADLFTKYLPEIDASTFVDPLLSYDRIRFNRVTLREIVDQLADAAGGDWYVDYDKKLHFFASENNPAPFGISDTPNMTTTFPHEKFTVNFDGSGIINRVEVVGGNFLSGDLTIYLAGTGQDERVGTHFSLSGPSSGGALQVWRNDGTQASPVWTAMTVKIGYIDTLSGPNDVLIYFNEKVLEQQNPWPNLTNAVKVFGRYNIPLRTRYTDNDSVAKYGRFLDAFINDANITDKQTARLRASGLMQESALSAIEIKASVRQPGLRSGMSLPVTHNYYATNSLYLIQRVTTSVSQGGYLICSLDLGEYRPQLTDLFVRLARQSKQRPTWRDDEVLDELLQKVEGIKVSEVATLATDSNHVYKWSPSAHDLIWSFGRWS